MPQRLGSSPEPPISDSEPQASKEVSQESSGDASQGEGAQDDGQSGFQVYVGRDVGPVAARLYVNAGLHWPNARTLARPSVSGIDPVAVVFEGRNRLERAIGDLRVHEIHQQTLQKLGDRGAKADSAYLDLPPDGGILSPRDIQEELDQSPAGFIGPREGRPLPEHDVLILWRGTRENGVLENMLDDRGVEDTWKRVALEFHPAIQRAIISRYRILVDKASVERMIMRAQVFLETGVRIPYICLVFSLSEEEIDRLVGESSTLGAHEIEDAIRRHLQIGETPEALVDTDEAGENDQSAQNSAGETKLLPIERDLPDPGVTSTLVFESGQVPTRKGQLMLAVRDWIEEVRFPCSWSIENSQSNLELDCKFDDPRDPRMVIFDFRQISKNVESTEFLVPRTVVFPDVDGQAADFEAVKARFMNQLALQTHLLQGFGFAVFRTTELLYASTNVAINRGIERAYSAHENYPLRLIPTLNPTWEEIDAAMSALEQFINDNMAGKERKFLAPLNQAFLKVRIKRVRNNEYSLSTADLHDIAERYNAIVRIYLQRRGHDFLEAAEQALKDQWIDDIDAILD